MHARPEKPSHDLLWVLSGSCYLERNLELLGSHASRSKWASIYHRGNIWIRQRPKDVIIRACIHEEEVVAAAPCLCVFIPRGHTRDIRSGSSSEVYQDASFVERKSSREICISYISQLTSKGEREECNEKKTLFSRDSIHHPHMPKDMRVKMIFSFFSYFSLKGQLAH